MVEAEERRHLGRGRAICGTGVWLEGVVWLVFLGSAVSGWDMAAVLRRLEMECLTESGWRVVKWEGFLGDYVHW